MRLYAWNTVHLGPFSTFPRMGRQDPILIRSKWQSKMQQVTYAEMLGSLLTRSFAGILALLCAWEYLNYLKSLKYTFFLVLTFRIL